MLTVNLTITAGLYAIITVFVTIMERSLCSVRSYCDNNWEVYVQCLHIL